ncbi:MAG: hypothetical protein OXC26_15060 [Albidovulum sp.]|nr:hypothetical protein [Albidovulum sp.]
MFGIQLLLLEALADDSLHLLQAAQFAPILHGRRKSSAEIEEGDLADLAAVSTRPDLKSRSLEASSLPFMRFFAAFRIRY